MKKENRDYDASLYRAALSREEHIKWLKTERDSLCLHNDALLLAVGQALKALEASSPLMPHYPEPRERHIAAIRACREALKPDEKT